MTRNVEGTFMRRIRLNVNRGASVMDPTPTKAVVRTEPEVNVVWKPRSGKVPDSKRCDRLTTSKLASSAQAAELPARRPTAGHA